MPNIARESLAIREDAHDLYRRAVDGKPVGPDDLYRLWERLRDLDDGIAAGVYLIRSGATADEIRRLVADREAHRKRRQRAQTAAGGAA